MAVSYSELSKWFADVKDKSPKEVGKFIGGKVEINVNAGTFDDVCAIRASYAFNMAGEPILSSDGAVSSGADGRWYLYRVDDMENFVKRVIGGTPLTGNSSSDFKGHKGIIFFNGCNFGGDATGHVDLYNGSIVEDQDYSDRCNKLKLYIVD